MKGIDTLQHLRDHLLSKTDIGLIDRKFCEQLSIAVFVKQNDYVSTTTIMRLFGLLPVDDRAFPARIIEILSQFANCKNTCKDELSEKKPQLSLDQRNTWGIYPII